MTNYLGVPALCGHKRFNRINVPERIPLPIININEAWFDRATKIAVDRNRGLPTVEDTKIIIKTYYYIKS